MKSLIVSIVLCCAGWSVDAQEKIQIVVLGTSHYNEAKDSVEQRKVINNLKAFQPDMIFGEFVKPDEYLQLEPESYRRKVNDTTFAYFHRRIGITKHPQQKIEKGLRALSGFSNLHSVRMELAAHYLQAYDLANAQYQLFILENYKKNHFGREENETYTRLFGNRDTLLEHGLYNETSEYHTILFPLMYENAIPSIYSMDCQTYDVDWSNAWRIVAYCWHYINRIAKMDPQSEEAKIVAKINEEKQRLYDESDSLGLEGYAYLNSIYNAEDSDIVNFYGGGKLFGFSENYPEKEVKEMMKYWRLRNEGMARNILEQARAKGAKRVVAAAGSAHQKWIADLLAEAPDVEIVPYNDL